ncbi:LOW QUALITY PROTEIN: solute carrier family 35 member F1 [Corvus hawaiiensis]|uniref:LOW QUALITY PROTEIN: solute carrier family 35 member F1 n=1 Tax=Corvus hawaiiensis TaxID=134902 RepID=UPI0020189BB7|nr:LOW QUALITY PROTEIN: solute carrier family 35 member F1 [Corvus hawaiiensis]
MLSPERHRHHRHPPPPQPPPPPHHPPQPSHVVATIENLPAEGGSGGGRSGISAPSSSVRQRIRKVLNRDLLLSVALGQVLSLLICGIGLTSKYLSEDFHANTPVFQSFLNYILLFLVYTTTLAVRQGEENLLAILKRRWWKYMILGIIDIEANYLVVKAYQYTTLTSVQLLDCFVIPVVILLSWFFLLVRYKAVHFIGIVVCILGMGCMAGADVLVGRQQGAGENKLIGDLLVLGGATLYGISNVCEEYIVRNLSRVEFLGMIGLFGSFFSGIQLAIMEHKELLKVPWDWQIGLLYVGFSACMFGLYSFMPVVIKKTSATAVNLSLLTADLYSLFCGLFLFHYKFSGLYLLSFFTILVGLMLYSSTSTYVAQDSGVFFPYPRVYKQFRNPSGPVVDLPATGQMEPSVTYTSLGQETEEEPHVRVA